MFKHVYQTCHIMMSQKYLIFTNYILKLQSNSLTSVDNTPGTYTAETTIEQTTL